MFKSNDIKNGIISSIIASILFLVIFQPFLDVLWNFLQKLSTRTYANYINGIYKNASLGQRNWIDFLNLQWGLAAFLIFIFTTLHRFRHTIDDMHDDVVLSELKDKNQRANYLKERAESRKKKIFLTIGKRPKLFKSLAIVYLISVCFIFFDTVFTAYVDLQLNSSFNQRLRVLRPFIDEQKEKQINAKWALMKRKDDYTIIEKELDSLAKVNKVTLPEKLLK